VPAITRCSPSDCGHYFHSTYECLFKLWREMLSNKSLNKIEIILALPSIFGASESGSGEETFLSQLCQSIIVGNDEHFTSSPVNVSKEEF
jgi:hypothetical protein